MMFKYGVRRKDDGAAGSAELQAQINVVEVDRKTHLVHPTDGHISIAPKH